jgi:hypothetical protein
MEKKQGGAGAAENDEQKQQQELIKTIEKVTLDEAQLTESQLLLQQQDPIVAVEKALNVRLDADTKELLRNDAASESTY